VLSPEDFGVAAMALTVVTGLQVLGDVGLGAALVQRERLTEAERSTAFWCTVLLAAVLAVAMILLARPAAAAPRRRRTTRKLWGSALRWTSSASRSRAAHSSIDRSSVWVLDMGGLGTWLGAVAR
jgi:O-antigen/teichoic acid export membrane protein